MVSATQIRDEFILILAELTDRQPVLKHYLNRIRLRSNLGKFVISGEVKTVRLKDLLERSFGQSNIGHLLGFNINVIGETCCSSRTRSPKHAGAPKGRIENRFEKSALASSSQSTTQINSTAITNQPVKVA